MGQNIAIIEYENNEINKEKEDVFDKEDVYWLKLWINKSDEKAKADFEAPIYVSEVSNYYHRLYDHYWGGGSDNFYLDSARFAVAASRTLKLNIDLNQYSSVNIENYDPDDVENMFAVKVSENSNELNKTKTFTYGTKYNIPLFHHFPH